MATAVPVEKSGQIKITFDPEMVEKLGKGVTIWDLMMIVACIVCLYVAMKQKNMTVLYYIGTSALLFLFALRVAVVRLSCNMPLREKDKERVLQWSSLYIAYLATRGAIESGINKKYIRTIMEGIIGFLFMFVFVKGIGKFMKNGLKLTD